MIRQKKNKLTRYEDINCCGEPTDYFQLSAGADLLNQVFNELLNAIWKGRKKYSSDYTIKLGEIYSDALMRGWTGKKQTKLALITPTDLNIDYTSPDWETISMMEMNIFKFSSTKSLAACYELNVLARQSQTFEEFQKKAGPLSGTLNGQYLRTEYNFAWTASQQAAEYNRLVKEKHQYPTWIYRTVGDARVREAHRKLDGKAFRADDEASAKVFPPNGWGDRCWIEPSVTQASDYTTEQDVEDILNSVEYSDGSTEWDRMKKGGFNVNRGKVKQIFLDSQMYAKSSLTAKLGIKDNGLPTFKDINTGDLPILKVNENSSPASALKWLDETHPTQIIKDYLGRPINIDRANFIKHLSDTKEGTIKRYALADLIPTIITEPDEVFLTQRGGDVFSLMYLKYYKDKPVTVITEIGEGGIFKMKTWYDLKINQIDNRRAGIVLKKISR